VILLALRSNLAGVPRFAEVIAGVREVTLMAYAHQDLPIDKLVEELRPERNLSHSPLVQVLFVQLNTPRATPSMGGIEVAPFWVEVQSKFDMAVFVRELGGEVQTSWLYNPDLFNADRVARMAQEFSLLIESVIADPKLQLSGLFERLARAEKQQRGNEHKKFQEAGLEKLKKIRRKAIVEV
jgi:non-ribosomal peptide synthetase component F